jgi:alpha-ketoglutarate-dependent taurine dioxygenase
MAANPKSERLYRTIDVQPLTGALGAEIRGLDLAESLDRETQREILEAFREHLVVYFPDQPISNERHVEFARLFGDVITLPQIFSLPECPQLQIVKRDAEARGAVVGGGWHTDSTFLERPPAAVMMRAMEVPAYGGDTAFSNMYLAYEALSPRLKELLDGLRAVHSGARVFGSRQAKIQKSFKLPEGKMEEGDREIVHPVVCTHPTSGRKHLFVNATFTQRFEGMTEEESAPLLQYLYQHCGRMAFTCRVRWRKNQLLIWDNRATHHHAIADYDGSFRYLLRATVEGPRPAP